MKREFSELEKFEALAKAETASRGARRSAFWLYFPVIWLWEYYRPAFDEQANGETILRFGRKSYKHLKPNMYELA